MNNGNARCKGIAIFGHNRVNIYSKPRTKREPCLETQEFIYFENTTGEITLKAAMNAVLQIILQNSSEVIRRLRICEVVNIANDENLSLFSKANINLEHQLFLDPEFTQVSSKYLLCDLDVLIFSKPILSDMKDVDLRNFLKKEGFIIYHGKYKDIEEFNWVVLYEATTEDEGIYLLRMKQELDQFISLRIQNENFASIQDLDYALRNRTDEKIILYSQEDVNSGIIGLTNSLLKEVNNIRSFWIDDEGQYFDINQPVYMTQFKRDLSVNVLRNGRWGTYIHCPLQYDEEILASNAAVSLNNIGDLSSLSWETSR